VSAGERRAVRALVSGRVQGVAFRHYTREQAGALGLAGHVRNLADGRVEVQAEGERAAVDALIAWLREGPPAARVAEVELEERPLEGRRGFEITR
jgi:acylphosphatase